MSNVTCFAVGIAILNRNHEIFGKQRKTEYQSVVPCTPQSISLRVCAPVPRRRPVLAQPDESSSKRGGRKVERRNVNA